MHFRFLQFSMSVQNFCSSLNCTKACLVPRIIERIEEGYLPALLSPCAYTPGAPYWMWVNRYQGDLVTVIDLDAPEYPHLNKPDLCELAQGKEFLSEFAGICRAVEYVHD